MWCVGKQASDEVVDGTDGALPVVYIFSPLGIV